MPGTDLKKKIKQKNCFALLKIHPFPPTPLKFPSLSNLLYPYYPKKKNCPTLLKNLYLTWSM